jgi:hypothetical protein
MNSTPADLKARRWTGDERASEHGTGRGYDAKQVDAEIAADRRGEIARIEFRGNTGR